MVEYRWSCPSPVGVANRSPECLVPRPQLRRRSQCSAAFSFDGNQNKQALVRQILGAVAQFEKAALVAKLKGARQVRRPQGAP